MTAGSQEHGDSAGHQGQDARSQEGGTGGRGAAAGWRIGVVLEAFLDWPLERIMAWLPEAAPEVTHLEVGAGGYAPHPHCDVALLLASAQARSAWLAGIAAHGLQVDALNAWGNPCIPIRTSSGSTTGRCATPSDWPRCSA
jgi:hypothetical protein